MEFETGDSVCFPLLTEINITMYEYLYEYVSMYNMYVYCMYNEWMNFLLLTKFKYHNIWIFVWIGMSPNNNYYWSSVEIVSITSKE